jgi:hypothetical protein
MARIIAMFTEKASAQQSCEECSDSTVSKDGKADKVLMDGDFIGLTGRCRLQRPLPARVFQRLPFRCLPGYLSRFR